MSEDGVSSIHTIKDETIVYRSQHDPQDETNLSTSVLVALNEGLEYDLENGDTVMFDHIDLDALDDIFRPVSGSPREGRVTFPVDQYEVTVTAAGEITITET